MRSGRSPLCVLYESRQGSRQDGRTGCCRGGSGGDEEERGREAVVGGRWGRDVQDKVCAAAGTKRSYHPLSIRWASALSLGVCPFAGRLPSAHFGLGERAPVQCLWQSGPQLHGVYRRNDWVGTLPQNLRSWILANSFKIRGRLTVRETVRSFGDFWAFALPLGVCPSFTGTPGT